MLISLSMFVKSENALADSTTSVISSIIIDVNHPAIVREIPHFDVFPAFPHFSENVPHFWLYFEKQIFLIIVIILGARKKLCA